MLKKVCAFALAVALGAATVGEAYADDTQGALAPGKAASVKQAADWWVTPHWVWIAGTGFVLLGFGLTVTGDHAGMVGNTTTCTLSGCATNNGGGTTTATATSTSTTTTTTTTTRTH